MPIYLSNEHELVMCMLGKISENCASLRYAITEPCEFILIYSYNNSHL